MYIKSYQPFMSQFLAFWQKNKSVVTKLIPAAFNAQFLSFESCLIVPVQRIPRYQLLLSDFLRHTPETHPDYADLKQVLDKITQVANYVNDMQNIYDGIKKVLEIRKRFGRQLTDDTGVTEFVRSHRRLLHQGFVNIEKNGKMRPAVLYLLNDLAVIGSLNENNTEGDKLYKLICLWQIDMEEDNENDCIIVKNHDDACIIMSIHPNPDFSRENWMNLFSDTLNKLNDAIGKGSDVETSKVHVNEGVQWNKAKSIPMEIAQALAATNAEKRNHIEVLSLKPTQDDAEVNSAPNSCREKILPRSTSVRHLSKKIFDRNSTDSYASLENSAHRVRSRRSTTTSHSIDHITQNFPSKSISKSKDQINDMNLNFSDTYLPNINGSLPLSSRSAPSTKSRSGSFIKKPKNSIIQEAKPLIGRLFIRGMSFYFSF